MSLHASRRALSRFLAWVAVLLTGASLLGLVTVLLTRASPSGTLDVPIFVLGWSYLLGTPLCVVVSWILGSRSDLVVRLALASGVVWCVVLVWLLLLHM